MAGADTTKALRIAKVIELLNKKSPYGGVSLKELADACEVTTRSILRYLDQIENDLKIPIIRPEKNTAKREGLYRLDAGYLPSVSPETALVILLSIIQQQGSALAGRLNEIKDALTGTLFKYKYSPQSLPVEQLQERIYLVEEQLADPAGVGEIFAGLLQALKDCYRVKLYYYTAHSGKHSKRLVEPYGLICKRHNWYLVAYCLKRNDIRVFRVDQVAAVIPHTSEHFAYPPDFSLQDYMAHCWGVINDGAVCQVKLKFSPRVACRVKNLVYHPSQTLQEELPDGSVVLSFEVCGIEEMKTWLVQWGDMVEVLTPAWLREDMCAMAEKILAVYK